MGGRTSSAVTISLPPYTPSSTQGSQKLVLPRHTSVSNPSAWAEWWRYSSHSSGQTPPVWCAGNGSTPCYNTSTSPPSPSSSSWPHAWKNTACTRSSLLHTRISSANKHCLAPLGLILGGIMGTSTGLVWLQQSKISLPPNSNLYPLVRPSSSSISLISGKALEPDSYTKRRLLMSARKNLCARLSLWTWPSRLRVLKN